MTTYAGVCRGGPFDGQSYSSEHRRLLIALMEPISHADLRLSSDAEPSIKHVIYRWAEPPGEWVWDE